MSTMRRFTTMVGLCALVALAACQTPAAVGKGAGASASASSYLATIRSSHGLPGLTADPQLEQAALRQSGYMARAGRMAHRTGYGKDFASRLRDDGIAGPAAENIARGRMELGQVFDAWMNSSGHRRNMLDPRFSRYGLASVEEAGGNGRKYWTLVLGR